MESEERRPGDLSRLVFREGDGHEAGTGVETHPVGRPVPGVGMERACQRGEGLIAGLGGEKPPRGNVDVGTVRREALHRTLGEQGGGVRFERFEGRGAGQSDLEGETPEGKKGGFARRCGSFLAVVVHEHQALAGRRDPGVAVAADRHHRVLGQFRIHAAVRAAGGGHRNTPE